MANGYPDLMPVRMIHPRRPWWRRLIAWWRADRQGATALRPVASAPASDQFPDVEKLVASFAALPAAMRPQLAYDDDDEPSFGAFRPGLYLDLTFDSPTAMSWYAITDRGKFHGDSVSFDGQNPPRELLAILSP